MGLAELPLTRERVCGAFVLCGAFRLQCDRGQGEWTKLS